MPATKTRKPSTKRGGAPAKRPARPYRWAVYDDMRKLRAEGQSESKRDAQLDALDKAQQLAGSDAMKGAPHPRFTLPTWRYTVYGVRGGAVIHDKPCNYSRVGR